MTTTRPKQTAHRGSVLASGLAIDTRLVSEEDARSRLIHFSSLGIDGFRVGSFLVGRFRKPVRLNCTATGGAPLVRYGSLHASAPLDADERKTLEQVGEILVLVTEGFASATTLDDAVREDISLWIDTSDFLIVENVRSLGTVVSEPRVQLKEIATDVRASLGVEAMQAEAAGLVQSLTRRHAEDNIEHRHAGTTISSFRQILGRLSHFIALTLKRQMAVAPPSSEIISESWLSKIQATFENWASRALLSSLLGRRFARRHADYLRQMFEMFDSNDLESALRHAIPLNTELEAALRPLPLRVPTARTDLAITTNRASSSTSMNLGNALFGELRQRYRRAFERLKVQGEIEKAAFVLAELLNESEEAVSFLERHGKFKLAAEIAEARSLSAGMVVRQWFLAGERGRAIAIARKTGAFADAVIRLESSHKEEGRALRLLWADSLASSGAYAAAVDAVWPIEAARRLALKWIDRAIEIGGLTGARMLARKARVAPGSFSDLRDQSLKLLRNESEDSFASAKVFGTELLAEAMTDETRVLARVTARTLLRAADNKEVNHLVRRLLDASGDAVFRADVSASTGRRARSPHIPVRVRAFTHPEGWRTHLKNKTSCIATLLDETARSSKGGAADGAHGVVLGVFADVGEDEGIASAIRDIVADGLERQFEIFESDASQWARCLAASLEEANKKVYWDSVEAQGEMVACSATVASLFGTTLILGQVGDTRGYVLRDGRLVQVTRDHSLRDDRTAARKATQVLGAAAQVRVDLSHVELQDGDVILVCSAGLLSVVNEQGIRKTLIERPDLKVACDALRSMAHEAGALGNITFVVARIEAQGLAQPAPLAFQPFVPTTHDGREQRPTLLRSVTTPIEIRRLAEDRGAISVRDAAELPDGRMLVALGEIGVWLISREGKVLTRFSEPTDQIVISDHGDRAILLARRGETFRVSRLDVITKRLLPWCDTRIDRFASDFDGSIWFVARQGTLYAIDAMAPRWEHLWKANEPGASAQTIRRDTHSVSAWFHSKLGSEVWTFESPSLTLRHRKASETDDVFGMTVAVSPAGASAGWQSRTDSSFNAHIFLHGVRKNLPPSIRFLDWRVAVERNPDLTDSWLALPVPGEEGITIHLFDLPGLQERARLRFERTLVRVRIQGERLVTCDEWGRVMVFSLKTGVIIREHRVS